MKVELLFTGGCKKCAAARENLKAVSLQAVPDISWREIDVLQELDYAVELGALTLPALAINGQLVFSSLPTATQLTEALQRAVKES